MAHSQSSEAIVLKTYDVGEADRFCILFTRERGRIAARASGVRRLTSKMGGALLPFRHVIVELKELSGGWIIAGAQAAENQRWTVRQFTALEEGMELLLRLVIDEGPLPEIFDVTLAFIHACREEIPHASLGYGFALLHDLGLLPGDDGLLQFASIDASDCAYLQQCRVGIIGPIRSHGDHGRLSALRSVLLDGHLGTPLRAGAIAATMA